MRLFVQGCLILLLCLFSLSAHARTKAEATTACQTYIGPLQGHPTYSYSCVDKPIAGNPSIVAVMSGNGSSTDQASWAYEPEVCETFSHEGSQDTECGLCRPGYVQVEGTGYTAPFQCMLNREPGECADLGLSEVQTSQGAFCAEECEYGMVNGVCLPPPEPEKECNKDSPDYRGVIVQGYGKPVIPACGDFDQCSDGSPGKVGFVNGELRCIADDYGQENECAADEIFIVDQYGVICAGLEDVPEEEPTPEEPNTDTDGDGQPDEYDPDNDPNINRKQLDELNKGQDQANKSLSNLEKIAKGTNDRLDDISGGMNDLVGLTGQINDKLDAPDGGFDISGFLNAPTMSESAQGMADYVSQTGYGQLLATLSSFPTSANCPVYTIPATDYWGALTMDVHCQVLSDYRGLFSALFMFFWSVTALFVFFRA